MKLKLSLLFFSVFSIAILSVRTIHAEENSSLVINRNIIINSKSDVDIKYVFEVKNNSTTDLVSGFSLNLPYNKYSVVSSSGFDNYQIEGDELRGDFFSNPINIGSTRSFEIDLSVESAIDSWGGFERFEAGNIQTSLALQEMITSIKYPQDWGQPVYINFEPVNQGTNSLLFSGNSNDILLVWGDSAILHISSDFEISNISGEAISPVINDDLFQNVSYQSIQGVDDLIFDMDLNAFFTKKEEGSISSQSYVMLSSMPVSEEVQFSEDSLEADFDYEFPEINIRKEDMNYDKIFRIADYLESNYQYSSRKDLDNSLKEFAGDEYNAALIGLLWLRSEQIQSYLTVGKDFSKIGDEDSLSYWINWKEDDKWSRFDINAYLQGNTDQINQISPERIAVLNLVNINHESIRLFEKLVKKDYQVEYSFKPDSTNLFNEISREQIRTHIIWDHNSNLNMIEGKLNITNSSGHLLNIRKITLNDKEIWIDTANEHYTRGVLPGSPQDFEIGYSRSIGKLFSNKQQINTVIKYQVGNQNIEFTQDEEIEIDLSISSSEMHIFFGIGAAIYMSYCLFRIIRKQKALDRLRSLLYNAFKKIIQLPIIWKIRTFLTSLKH